MMPRFTNTSMRRAESAITTRSQASTRLAPPPAAVPLTAATTGFSQSRIDATRRCQPRRIMRATSPRARSGAPSGRGGSGFWAPPSPAPVQKCFSPAPVSTTARTPRVAESSSNVSARWSRISAVSELPASGRSIVTRAIATVDLGADQVGHGQRRQPWGVTVLMSAWRTIPWATATLSEVAEPAMGMASGDVGEVAQRTGESGALGAEQQQGRPATAGSPGRSSTSPVLVGGVDGDDGPASRQPVTQSTSSSLLAHGHDRQREQRADAGADGLRVVEVGAVPGGQHGRRRRGRRRCG